VKTCAGRGDDDGSEQQRLPVTWRRTSGAGRDLGRKVRLAAQGRGRATPAQGEDARRRHEGKIRSAVDD
jgi:hypothetical protein